MLSLALEAGKNVHLAEERVAKDDERSLARVGHREQAKPAAVLPVLGLLRIDVVLRLQREGLALEGEAEGGQLVEVAAVLMDVERLLEGGHLS